MTKQLFTSIETVNAYDHPVTVYRSADGKLEVTVYDQDKDGTPFEEGYWWIKLKTRGGPGNDEALNLSREHCEVLEEILKSIRTNEKYSH